MKYTTTNLPEPFPKRLERFVADILFPKRCIACGAPDTFLCDACLSRVPRKRSHTCPICQTATTPDGMTCLSCRKRASLDGVFSVATFREDRVVSEAIHVLKYEYVPDLALPLGQLLANGVRDSELPLPDLIIPVPLHPWRLRYRGFNQSERIAQAFLDRFMPELDIPLRDDLLHRVRFTLPQAKSPNAKARKKNLRGAFAIDSSVKRKGLKGKAVWLVDDVATTGATLEECAKVLKQSGAKNVFGIVVAR